MRDAYQVEQTYDMESRGSWGLKCVERLYGIDNDGLELAIFKPE